MWTWASRANTAWVTGRRLAPILRDHRIRRRRACRPWASSSLHPDPVDRAIVRPLDAVRPALYAMTFMQFGVQVIFGSFFLALLRVLVRPQTPR